MEHTEYDDGVNMDGEWIEKRKSQMGHVGAILDLGVYVSKWPGK